MANFDFNEAREAAEEILTEFGDPLSAVKKGSSYQKDAFGQPVAATEDESIDGICSPLLPYDTQMMKDSYEQTGEKVIAGDQYAYFHSDTIPSIGMELSILGVVHRIQSIVGLGSLSGVRVYTKIQLRS